MQVNDIDVTFTIRIDENTELTVSESQARLLLEKLAEVFGFELFDSKNVDVGDSEEGNDAKETLRDLLKRHPSNPQPIPNAPWYPPYDTGPWISNGDSGTIRYTAGSTTDEDKTDNSITLSLTNN